MIKIAMASVLDKNLVSHLQQQWIFYTEVFNQILDIKALLFFMDLQYSLHQLEKNNLFCILL